MKMAYDILYHLFFGALSSSNSLKALIEFLLILFFVWDHLT